jgi:hypothetical protein
MQENSELKDVAVVGVSTLERPTYSAGLLLEDSDLTAGVDYTRDLSRLLFRSLFGCGVICGLELTPTLECDGRALHIKVGKGLALDCEGNPIELPKEALVKYDKDCEPFKSHLWVAVCYKPVDCRPRDADCGWDSDGRRRLRMGQ